MHKLMKRLLLLVCAVGLLGLSACDPIGPLTIELAPSQVFSGANRTMESAVDLTSPPEIGDVEYKVFGDLQTPRVSGFAFSIALRFDAKDGLREVAAALGVSGEPIKQSKNTFTVGFNKDTGAGVWLWIDDAGSWWSYFPGNTSGASAPSAGSCDVNSACDVGAPIKPKNLLSTDEAEARATRFLLSVGYRLNNFRLSATQNDYSTDVEGKLFIAGIPTNLGINFSFGDNGVISAASGPFVVVRRANGYYLISPEEGVKRLSDTRYSTVATFDNSSVGRVATSVSMPPQSRMVVPITRVEYTLMQSLMANNNTILLPAYTYYNEDGVVGTVIAMKNEYLSFGQMPVNTDEPSPLNTVSRATTSGSSVSTAPAPAKTPATPESVRLLVGLTEYGANKVAKDNGWALRVAMKDGVAFQLTADYSDSRVNLTVVNGIVTAVSIG